MNVFIATPCHSGSCKVEYIESLMKTIELFKNNNIKYEVKILNGDSILTRARNSLVALFMNNPSFTHLLFIDDDIAWSQEGLIDILKQDKPIIGAFCPKKALNLQKTKNINNILESKTDINNLFVNEEAFIVHNLVDYCYTPLTNTVASDGNYLEVNHIGTGFMVIKREVFTKMINDNDETIYIDDTNAMSGTNIKYCYNIFTTKIVNNCLYGEDWMFCEQWKKMGGEIYGHLGLSIVHIGNFRFSGRIASTLKFA